MADLKISSYAAAAALGLTDLLIAVQSTHTKKVTLQQVLDFINTYGRILTATKVLTSGQILALHTTPINIIPAPVAGSLILIDNVTYKGTGAYTNAGGSGLVYHGTSVAADESYAVPANPWVNGVVLSGRVQTNLNVTTALGLGVDIAGVAADPTVGATPATVIAQYRILAP